MVRDSTLKVDEEDDDCGPFERWLLMMLPLQLRDTVWDRCQSRLTHLSLLERHLERHGRLVFAWIIIPHRTPKLAYK